MYVFENTCIIPEWRCACRLAGVREGLLGYGSKGRESPGRQQWGGGVAGRASVPSPVSPETCLFCCHATQGANYFFFFSQAFSVWLSHCLSCHWEEMRRQRRRQGQWRQCLGGRRAGCQPARHAVSNLLPASHPILSSCLLSLLGSALSFTDTFHHLLGHATIV